MDCKLYNGDCLDVLPSIESGSIDCVFTDPPYAEIDREYGRLTEPQWHEMMREVVNEVRRILKPSGSAVFVIQPNYEKVGRMRLWVWEFMVWVGREWNIVQNVYWWNNCAVPLAGCNFGLTRASVKYCIWLGSKDCFRNQNNVVIKENKGWIKHDQLDDVKQRKWISGATSNPGKMMQKCIERGGSTPFNLLTFAGRGSKGHPAATPMKLTEWWIKYICPINGTVLDPFMGSGTTGKVCQNLGRSFIGIERFNKYFEIASERLKQPEFMGASNA